MTKTAKRAAPRNMDAGATALEVVTRAGKTFDKKVLGSEAKAKAFLLRTGIYTPSGRLTAKYK